jgi:hypothetical protein
MTKRKLFTFAGAAALLPALMVLAGCGTLGGGGGGGGSIPEPKGMLTITNVPPEHEGKYVWISGGPIESSLSGTTEITGKPPNVVYKLVKIEGGTAAVPLYTVYMVGGAGAFGPTYKITISAYEGNDPANLSIYLINDDDGLLTNTEAAAATQAVETALLPKLGTLGTQDEINAAQLAEGKKTLLSVAFSNGSLTVDWAR